MYNEIIISNLLKLKEKLIEEINNNPSDISNKFKLKTIINTFISWIFMFFRIFKFF